MQELLTTKGQGEFRHTKGEISKVRIEAVGLGIRRVRIGNLPPEVSDRAECPWEYTGSKGQKEENWSRAYRHQVANDIRIAMLTLLQHIPSHIVVAGHRALISYEGQPTTCHGCNETGHLYQVCPQRRAKLSEETTTTTSWVDVAGKGVGAAP
jgi:hypothetical protein